jgi:hypothetical protein
MTEKKFDYAKTEEKVLFGEVVEEAAQYAIAYYAVTRVLRHHRDHDYNTDTLASCVRHSLGMRWVAKLAELCSRGAKARGQT